MDLPTGTPGSSGMPLGMEMTDFLPMGEAADWVTVGHEPGDVVPIEADAHRGAGGLYSKAREMLVCLEANVNLSDDLLGQAMRLAHEARVATDEAGVDYGLGWQVRTIAERSTVMHGGRHNGFMTWICFEADLPRGSADERTRIWIDATLFRGRFAFIIGTIGAVVGLIRTFQGYEAAGRFASPPVAQGLVMLCLSAILGLSILALAALLWFFLQLRWRPL